MKRYPAYKDSGIEWIGEIPENWSVSKLKYETRISSSSIDKKEYEGFTQYPIIHYNDVVKNKKIGNNEVVDYGFCAKSQFESFKVSKGEIIVTKDSMDIRNVCDSSIIVENLGRCVFGYHLTKFSIKSSDLIPEYLFFYFNNPSMKEFFLVNSNGTTIIGVSKSTFKNTFINLPSLFEQHQIVSILDTKTQQIDTLIEKKQKQIGLLKELRTAIINQAVNKGLNPNVKMKDSGIEWVGEIPRGWTIKKVSYLSDDMISGPFGSSLKKEFYTKTGYKIYGQEQVIKDDFEYGDYFISEEKFEELKRCEIFTNDILISCVGTFGKISIVPEKFIRGIINPRLLKITPNELIKPNYFLILLRSDISFTQFESLSRGGTMGVINLDILRQVKFPLPSIEEQIQIINHIDEQTQKMDVTIKKETQRIELLKEYRQSFISEVVTGKIDVKDEVVV